MAAPRVPNATIVDPKGRIAREWLRYFQDLSVFLLTLTNDVTSVFGRTGAVVSAASDYDASQIDNDSSVSGAFVDDALNTLLAAVNKRAWVLKTAAYTAVAFDKILGDTATTAAFTVTLPASPTLGDEIWVHDPNGNWATDNLTLAGNGKNIDGSSSLVLSTNNDTVMIVYNNTEWTRAI